MYSLRPLLLASTTSTLRSASLRSLSTIPSSSSSSSTPSSPSAPPRSTVNASEIAHFARLSSQWWDEKGELGLLHKMNPPRLEFIREKLQESKWRDGDESNPLIGADWLKGMRVLDVGCGGGLLSESLARLGASTLGIDATPSNIPLAQSHALLDPFFASPLTPTPSTTTTSTPSTSSASTSTLPSTSSPLTRLEYRHQTAEDLLASGGPEQFDVVCAMEVLEHVDDPKGFLMDLSRLVKPGGHLLLSTISRTPLAHFLTVTVAEDLLRLVSRGTHTSSKFVKPEELDDFFDEQGWRTGGREARGIVYLPWKGEWELVGKNVGWVGRGANYVYGVRKPKEGRM